MSNLYFLVALFVLLLLLKLFGDRPPKRTFVINLSIEGGPVMNPANMTDIQTAHIHIAEADSVGNPTNLSKPPVFTLVDPSQGSLDEPVVNADGSVDVDFHPATVPGKLGAVVVNIASQDPDPAITGSVTLNVGPSAAAQFLPQVSIS